jgi:predicted N-acyltransferase
MPDGSKTITIRIAEGVGSLSAAAWDACAGSDNPFLSHGFFSALEESGSACAETGWLPQHLVVDGPDGEPLAIAPLYLKSHSYGEYVFDWGWADAYQRAGGRYYPKLQASVPFTPVPGRRLLVRPGAPSELQDALAAGMCRYAERVGASSVHVTFPLKEEWERLGRHGFLQRIGQQFHWGNDGYRDFGDFLARLSSRKRKAIRKEREKVREEGIEIGMLSGPDITEAHWDAFYRFYKDTTDRKWGERYLKRRFFSLLHERLSDRIVLFLAMRSGRPIGGALNLAGRDTLYGRYWGAVEDHPFLHFETCYYQAIEYAIARGLSRVEAGAQGPHKLQRGYLPVETYSAHWIADPRLRAAVAGFLDQERAEVRAEMRALAEESPFRQE